MIYIDQPIEFTDEETEAQGHLGSKWWSRDLNRQSVS